MKILTGIDCVATFPKVTRELRFYGVRFGRVFVGISIGGEQIDVDVKTLTAALGRPQGTGRHKW